MRAAVACAVATVVTTSAAWTVAPASSRACSRGSYVAGAVVAGADGLAPTDVVPLLVGNLAITSYVLRPIGGEAVAIEVREHRGPSNDVTAAEIDPVEPLRPSTEYEIVLEGTFETPTGLRGPIRFRTGAGPLGGEAPPAPEVLTFSITDTNDSCGGAQLCFEHAPAAVYEVTVRSVDGAEVEGTTVVTPDNARLYRSLSSAMAPFCVEARARDLAGRLSPPIIRCSDTAPLACGNVATHCEPSGLFAPSVCDAGPALPASEPAGGGCACHTAAPAKRTAAWVAPLVPMLIAALGLLRRRSRRA